MSDINADNFEEIIKQKERDEAAEETAAINKAIEKAQQAARKQK